MAPDTVLDGLLDIARDLRGLRLLQLNATPHGGGVSELLRSAVPLLNGLGIATGWKVIAATRASSRSRRRSTTASRAQCAD